MAHPLDVFGPRPEERQGSPLDIFGPPRGTYGPWEDTASPLVQRRRKPDGTYETRPNPNAVPGGKTNPPETAPNPYRQYFDGPYGNPTLEGVKKAANAVRLGAVEGADFLANLPETVGRAVGVPTVEAINALREEERRRKIAAQLQQERESGRPITPDRAAQLERATPRASVPIPPAEGLSGYGLPEIVDETLQSARDEGATLQEPFSRYADETLTSPVRAAISGYVANVPRVAGNLLDPATLGLVGKAGRAARAAGAAEEVARVPLLLNEADRSAALLTDRSDEFLHAGFGGEDESRLFTRWLQKNDVTLAEAERDLPRLREEYFELHNPDPTPPREFYQGLQPDEGAQARRRPVTPEVAAPEPSATHLPEIGPQRGTERPVPAAESHPLDVFGPDPARPAAIERVPEMPEGATSLKNAVAGPERAARGLPAVEIEGHRLDADWAAAQARVAEDPAFPRRLAEQIEKEPRTLSPVENNALTIERKRLSDEFSAALDAEDAALSGGDPAAIADARLRRSHLEQALDLNDRAAARGGHEWHAAGMARQQIIREDYSPARLLLRARVAASGQEVAAPVRERLVKISRELDSAMTASSAAENAATQKAAERAVVAMRREAAHAARKGRRALTREALDSEFSSLSSEFGKLANRPRTGLDPELAGLAAKMARNRVQAGVVVLEEVVDHVYQALRPHLDDLTPRDVRDAISGYGKTSQPSKDAVAAQLRELRAQGRLVSALEDAQGGVRPLKSGFQRGEESAQVRALRQQVNEAMKAHGIGPTIDPAEQMRSALDAAKTRLRRQIEEMTKRLETGAPPRTRTPLAYDAEATALKADRDRLKAALDEIDGPAGITDAQRLKIAEGATERSVLDLEARLAAGDIAPRRVGGGASPWSPKLGELRRRQVELRQQLQDLRDAAKPPVDPEAARLAALKTRLAKREEELRAQLASGNFAKKPRPAPVALDQDAIAARARVNDLKLKADRMIRSLELQNRSGLEKGLDWTAGWGRFVKLTNIPTLLKLGAAASERALVFKPMEEFIGAGLSKLPVVRKVAARAPIEGGGSLGALAKSYAGFFSRRAREESAAYLKGGTGPMELALGKKGAALGGESPAWMEIPGKVHAAIKAPAKIAAYEYAMEKQAKRLLSQGAGADLLNPITQAEMQARAWEYANRDIFMNDNAMVRSFRKVLQDEPGQSMVAKAGKTGGKVLFPIVKVPTNYALEVTDYTLGLPKGLARLAVAVRKGVETLPAAEAEQIMRQLKKGTLGAGLIALGASGLVEGGGYYEAGKHRSGSDLQPGELRVAGITIPHLLLHHPAVEALQVGAALHRARTAEQGLGTAAWGVAEQVPFFEEPIGAARDLRTDPSRFFGSIERGMTIPPDVQRAARMMDQKGQYGAGDYFLQGLGLEHIDARRRKTRGPFLEQMYEEEMLGIPGLRDNVR